MFVSLGQALPLFILLAVMLIITLMRVAVPIGQTIEGKAIRHVDLSYRERLLLHRTNIYAIGVVLLLTALGGALPLIVELVVVLATLLIVLMPARYILTSEGVALNNVVFRRWAEFDGAEIRRGRLRLQGRAGAAPLTLSVLAVQRPEVVDLVERLVAGHQPRIAHRAAARTRARAATSR